MAAYPSDVPILFTKTVDPGIAHLASGSVDRKIVVSDFTIESVSGSVDHAWFQETREGVQARVSNISFSCIRHDFDDDDVDYWMYIHTGSLDVATLDAGNTLCMSSSQHALVDITFSYEDV